VLALGGDAGLRGKLAQARAQLLLLARQPQELLAHLARGLDVEPPAVAVDDDLAPLEALDGELGHAHHGGDAERAGEDGHVRGARAVGGDDRRQTARGHLPEVGGRDLLAHQHRALGPVAALAPRRLELGEDAPAEVAHVRGPLPEVGVVHGVEDARVLLDGLAQGARRPAPGADALDGVGDEAVAREHQDVGVEEGAVLGPELRPEARLELAELLGDRGHRLAEGACAGAGAPPAPARRPPPPRWRGRAPRRPRRGR